MRIIHFLVICALVSIASLWLVVRPRTVPELAH